MSPSGSTVNPYGGGYGVNTGPRNGSAGPAGDQPFGATNFVGGDTRMGVLPPNVTPEQVYSDLMRDLAFDTEIVVMPIVREESGLALSSRNAYLNERSEERRVGKECRL